MSKELEALQTYFDLMSTNGMSYVFKIASEVGVFNTLASNKELSGKSIAKKLDLLEYPTCVLCDALVEMNVLTKNSEQYSLTPVMHFLSGNYQNLSSEYWEHFPHFLKTGEPFKKMDTTTDSEKEYQVQVKALEWMMGPCAKMAQTHAKELLDNIENVLDLGCGSGVWSMAFLQDKNPTRATLVDWPAVLKVALDSAKSQGFTNQIETIEGNFHEANLKEDFYDLAILGNVTHIETPKGCQDLFNKSFKSLKSGGALVIHDVYGTHPKGEIPRLLYRLGLSVRTVQGRVHTPDEMRPWLEKSGFTRFEFKSLDVTPYSMGSFYAFKP